MYKNFPTPHCHIQSIDSASTIEAFIQKELRLGTGYITCTDHGYMGACSDVYDLAKKNHLTPILGVEGYFRDDNDSILSKFNVSKDENGTYKAYAKYYHITLHAKNQAAYEQICKQLSKSDLAAEYHGGERKPLFSWAQLEEICSYDITIGSGCLVGMVSKHIIGKTPRPDIAEAYYCTLRQIVKPGNFYVEIFPHKCDKTYSNSVFVETQDGKKLRFYPDKKLKTNEGEMAAADLAKNNKVNKILAIKNYKSWQECDETIKTVKVEKGFTPNECTVLSPDGDIQLTANKFMLELAQKYGDPIILSDDSHFSEKDEKIVQDIRLGGKNSTWQFYENYHRYSSDDAWPYFKDVLRFSESKFQEMIENNISWASNFNGFVFKDRKQLPAKFYPSDTVSHLKTLIDKHGRMKWDDKVKIERLQKEIKLFHKNGTIDLLPYFFFSEEAREEAVKRGGLNGPGRGSAAGTLVAYLLEITDVDPIRYELSLDRFITLDRIASGKFPDIDMDFSNREVLINSENGWLFERFSDHAAAVSNNSMMRLKSSIKDVERALLGEVRGTTEALCKSLENPPQGVNDNDWLFGYVGDDGVEVKGYWEECKDLQDYAKQNPKIWESVLKALGVVRQKSIHASAYVVANEPISNFIPVMTVAGKTRATAYTKDAVENRGGIKMDFLGLNSLKDIDGAIKLIQKRNNIPQNDIVIDGLRVGYNRIVPYNGKLYDVWDLPQVKEVYKEICAGNNNTTFQLDTSSSQKWLKHFNFQKENGDYGLNSIEDLSVFVALNRPGPLDAMISDGNGGQHNMLVEYTHRLRGNSNSEHVLYLEKELPETFGILVYQEQLEKVYQKLTDCTGGQAVEFRSNIAKKKVDKVKKAYPNFIEKAKAKIGEEDAQKIWDQMVTFGSYGFNCIEESQKIMTDSGDVEISKICENPQNYYVAYIDDDDLMAFEQPSHAQFMGEKECYEVELEDGSTIRATEDHRFLYNGEFATLRYLINERRIYCCLIGNTTIVKVKNIGIKKVYDIEMPTCHNFVLDNGAVAHNCSHSVSYSLITYACAFLKHFYPIEWWCAVLQNADKNEIADKFWPFCKHYVDLPDIRYSENVWVIKNDRIIAPLSVFKGIGEKAHEELCKGQPYTNIRDFCNKIVKNGSTHALNKGVIYKLILSNSMDSLFFDGFNLFSKGKLTVFDKLDQFEQCFAAAQKRSRPDRIDPSYAKLSALERFQIKKEILSMISEDLRQLLSEIPNTGVNKTSTKAGFQYSPSSDSDLEQISNQLVHSNTQIHSLALVSSPQLKYLSELSLSSDQNGINVAVAGIISELREFSYKRDGLNKTAVEVKIDIEGTVFSFVKWPSKKDRKYSLTDIGVGSIVIASLLRRDNKSKFQIDYIVEVQKPRKKIKDE